EPASYDLGNLLQQGVLAVQPRTHEDAELGQQLIMFAAKRSTGVLDKLLGDTELLESLGNNFGKVLRTYNGDALVFLQNRGPELFSAAMARAARAKAGVMFTPPVIEKIWEIYGDGSPL